MAQRGIHRKVSEKDWFGWKYFCPNTKRAMVRNEKKENHRAMRKYNKQIIQSEMKEYEEDNSWCNGLCEDCIFSSSCCDYYGPERETTDWRLYKEKLQ
jgi:hypothetical protein